MPNDDDDAIDIARDEIRSLRRTNRMLMLGLMAFVGAVLVAITGVGLGIEVPGMGTLHLDHQSDHLKAQAVDTGLLPAAQTPKAPEPPQKTPEDEARPHAQPEPGD